MVTQVCCCCCMAIVWQSNVLFTCMCKCSYSLLFFATACNNCDIIFDVKIKLYTTQVICKVIIYVDCFYINCLITTFNVIHV